MLNPDLPVVGDVRREVVLPVTNFAASNEASIAGLLGVVGGHVDARVVPEVVNVQMSFKLRDLKMYSKTFSGNGYRYKLVSYLGTISNSLLGSGYYSLGVISVMSFRIELTSLMQSSNTILVVQVMDT